MRTHSPQLPRPLHSNSPKLFRNPKLAIDHYHHHHLVGHRPPAALVPPSKELDLLRDDANVYKLIGLVLVKQDLAEANANVRKRIEVWFCAAVSGPLVSSTYWLLFFEPLSIAFETLQAMVVHGFQLMDIWLHHSAAETSDSQRSKLLDSTAGASSDFLSVNIRQYEILKIQQRIQSVQAGKSTA